jgi:hypothetical protein
MAGMRKDDLIVGRVTYMEELISCMTKTKINEVRETKIIFCGRRLALS